MREHRRDDELFPSRGAQVQKGDTILVFEPEVKSLCVLLSGKAHLYCVDSEGEYTLLENYVENDIFGEVFTMPYSGLGYVAEADSDCSVMFFKMSTLLRKMPKCMRASYEDNQKPFLDFRLKRRR